MVSKKNKIDYSCAGVIVKKIKSTKQTYLNDNISDYNRDDNSPEAILNKLRAIKVYFNTLIDKEQLIGKYKKENIFFEKETSAQQINKIKTLCKDFILQANKKYKNRSDLSNG